jgi:hypothetical protein
MDTNHTPQDYPEQEALAAKRSKRSKLIDLGKQRLRRRAPEGLPDTTPHPSVPRKLRPAATLGYFTEHFKQTVVFQVQYGSEQNVWVKAAVFGDDENLPTSWREFEYFDRSRRYKQFSFISWRNGITTFSYNGDQMEPSAFPLHSPAEAIVQYRALILYWHFTKGYPLRPTDGIIANEYPEYLDPTDPPRPTEYSGE